MMQPPSFEDSSCPTHVCRLQKALYGLKQAPRAWFHKLSSFLLQIGFQCSRVDASLFYFHSAYDIIILLIYVDDILITGNNPSRVHQIISQLSSHFALRDLGDISYFLGIEVTRLSHALHLNQQRYIHQLLERANLHEAKSASTPGALGKLLSAVDGEPLSALDATHYRSLVGVLQYITLTRPEISFVVLLLMVFLSMPHHLCLFKDIPMQIGRHVPMIEEAPVVFVFFLALISSHGPPPSNVLSLVVVQNWSIGHLLFSPLSATALAANSVFHARSKHIEIDLHFVRDKVLHKELLIQYVPPTDQLADVFTKHVPSCQFSAARTHLSVVPRPVSLRGDDRQTPIGSPSVCDLFSEKSSQHFESPPQHTQTYFSTPTLENSTKTLNNTSHQAVRRSIMVIGVDDAVQVRAFFLDGFDGEPQDPLTIIAIIGIWMEESEPPSSIAPAFDD
ncbi:Retrovirus-related Pol polyprotein from transposon RE1 [Vitis vinifera]|uniref:Retrovirus-related Pol polyprotein from transposon RE1 n=1 Tax=Vitis vinifera TaxID=29760 RepID=A0A438GAK4_VITVI|nr:Retrovirus-related Pol polyprotein from transposon RE1 [Vitis vinifera]